MKTGSSFPMVLSAIAGAALIALAACSSNTVTSAPAPAATTPAEPDPTPDPDPNAAPAVSPYPSGPYGNTVGKVLPGWDANIPVFPADTKGLASTAPLAPVKVSDVRAMAVSAGAAKYMLIHVSAYWCGICRAAVTDLVSQYPKLASKAIFVDILEEGVTPDDTTTKANLDAWIKGLAVPYTAVRDPDGVQWSTRTKIGHNKTALLVELATMKIIEQSDDDYTVVLDKLNSLK